MPTTNTVGISVVFCDLVGSTAMAARVGAAEAERLRTGYFDILRSAVARHGGEKVKSTGDGIMAVFPGVSSAMDAAVEMHQELDRHNRSGDEPMQMRVGISTGDCIPSDGDYYGEAVIQAARLCDRAVAGQILATAVVGMLAPRGSYEFTPVGGLELKGLPEPVATLELSWAAEYDASPVPLQSRLTIEHMADFVGRDEEMGVLTGALAEAAAGERRVVLLTGEAGLGKTRLTSHFAAEAHGQGTLVLYGRCEEDLATPYRPWAELLGHIVEHSRDEVERALDELQLAELARIVPALRSREHEADEAGGSDRYALFAAATSLLASLTENQPAVLVLDDLHWADHESLALMRHVVSELPAARMLIIGTYRQTDVGADDPLTQTSTWLHREPGVERLAMRGLTDTEVVALVEAVAGHELDSEGRSLAHSLWAETSGSPFFVTELLRHLAESGSIIQGEDGRWSSTVDLTAMELPQSVRDVVGQRVQRLGGTANRVLSTAAVVGREFDLGLVSQALDVDEDDVLDVLEGALAAGLVAEVAGADRFGFTHALVQHTLYDDLSASRRARAHRRVAEALEARVGAEPGEHVGELANHWLAAVQPSDGDRALCYAIAAGDRALVLRAPEEAVRWYGQALEATPDESRPRAEVLVKLGDAERQAGRPGYRERLLDAARLAQRLGADDLLVAAAINNFRGWFSTVGAVDEDRVAVLEAALDHVAAGDNPDRARLMATLAGELAYSNQERRFDIGREAVEMARRLGEPELVLDVSQRITTSLNVPNLYADRATRAEEVMRLSAGQDDRVKRFFALELQIDVYLVTPDLEGARRCDAERTAIAAELRQPTLRWFATNGRALLDLIEGDVERAEQQATQAFQLGNDSGQPDAMTLFGALLLAVRWHQGRSSELIDLLKQFVANNPGVSTFRCLLAIFLADEGDLEGAVEVMEPLIATDFDLPFDLLWLTSNMVGAEAVTLIGHRRAGELLYERLLPYAELIAASRATFQGPVAYPLGLLATMLGRPAEAEAHLDLALQRGTQARAPWHRARAMVAQARLLAERSPERSAQLAAEAAALAERHGMARLGEQAVAIEA